MQWEEHYDDISGDRLNPDMVRQARKEYLAEVHKHRVYNNGTTEQVL